MSLDFDLQLAYDLYNRRRLRWCRGGVCACMGCANREISKETFDRITAIPEIKSILDRDLKENHRKQREFLKRIRNGDLCIK